MWERISYIFRCPLCKNRLNISILKVDKRIPGDVAEVLAERWRIKLKPREPYIIEGLFTCESCKTWYPIHRGLPVFLPYQSPLRRKFVQENRQDIVKTLKRYSYPNSSPNPGEEFVMEAFSKEWIDYKYDGTLWTWSYEDRKKLLNCELGSTAKERNARIIDVGCGIGITTSFAASLYNAEGIGIDLSLSVMQASYHFSQNPFLHFVQCSVFALPFSKETFNYVYSHGVLHHTYSTKVAFQNVAKLCKKGGKTYLWVYGPGSINDSVFRRIAYAMELIIRPLMNKLPSQLIILLVSVLVPVYLISNKMMRKKNPGIAKYNFRRAIHAVRDRFTPAYAHRQSKKEVLAWFIKAKFENLVQVKEDDVPLSAKPDFRMNIGIRGVRSQID